MTAFFSVSWLFLPKESGHVHLNHRLIKILISFSLQMYHLISRNKSHNQQMMIIRWI
jgi:hypothetical protein